VRINRVDSTESRLFDVLWKLCSSFVDRTEAAGRRDSSWRGVDHLKRRQPLALRGRPRLSKLNYGPGPLRCQAPARNFLLTISKQVQLPTRWGRGPVCHRTAERRGGGVASGFDDVGYRARSKAAVEIALLKVLKLCCAGLLGCLHRTYSKTSLLIEYSLKWAIGSGTANVGDVCESSNRRQEASTRRNRRFVCRRFGNESGGWDIAKHENVPFCSQSCSQLT